MIGLLRGRVAADDGTHLLIDVGGVGYDVAAPAGTLGKAKLDERGHVELFVHTHVREDALDLYAFATELERRVFRLLLAVPNVGPKTALAVLSVLPPPELAAAVDAADVKRLGRVPGIGKKTAERLALELRERLSDIGAAAPTAQTPARPPDAERLMTALTNMGYRAPEAERAVKALGDRVGQEPLSELLRQALAHLTP